MEFGLVVPFLGRSLTGWPWLAQQRQRRLHFVASVHIARLLRNHDPVGQKFAGLVESAQSSKELSELIVTCDVIGIRREEVVEVSGGCGTISQLHAFKRQPIPREGICRFLGDKVLQNFTSRLLRLRHCPRIL